MPLNPELLYPLPGHPRMVFLKNAITAPNIIVGDYTYYDDPDDPKRFQERNVLYHFPFIGDQLIIGKFCAIAARATFIMNGGNHTTNGFSTFPFSIFGAELTPAAPTAWPYFGDTVVGHDVWIGYDALIMPGVKIGHGAIIGTRAVVTHEVEPYCIVAGNPAKVIRRRFDEPTCAALLRIAWWDWPVEKIMRNAPSICGQDLSALQRAE